MLHAGEVIHARGGIVTCANPANGAALAKVLDRFTHPHLQHDRRNRAAVRMLGPNGEPILCSVSNMVPDDPGTPGSEQPVALLSFASLAVPPAQLDAEFLASLYDFTPAEMRLVSALLRGEDLIAIANANFVSVATLRSQLKSVFAKTNTHRQAQLVQLLLTALLL
jgi:DNA-binding CsgD family transcriptional regulator